MYLHPSGLAYDCPRLTYRQNGQNLYGNRRQNPLETPDWDQHWKSGFGLNRIGDSVPPVRRGHGRGRENLAVIDAAEANSLTQEGTDPREAFGLRMRVECVLILDRAQKK